MFVKIPLRSSPLLFKKSFPSPTLLVKIRLHCLALLFKKSFPSPTLLVKIRLHCLALLFKKSFPSPTLLVKIGLYCLALLFKKSFPSPTLLVKIGIHCLAHLFKKSFLGSTLLFSEVFLAIFIFLYRLFRYLSINKILSVLYELRRFVDVAAYLGFIIHFLQKCRIWSFGFAFVREKPITVI